MTTIECLTRWKVAGTITDTQFDTLSTLAGRKRFSVFRELNALVYIGILSLVGGLGWTFQSYFTSLGDTFILISLTASLLASLAYCFLRAQPYSNLEVASPNWVLDYALYFGCLVLSVELGYIEFRFHVLREAWDGYLLFSALAFFFFAYRFDNRFVLSLALSGLAGWFGLRTSRFGMISGESLKICGLAYGAIVILAGVWLYRSGIKKHFLETYLHIAANVLFLAALSGSMQSPTGWIYLAVLIALATTAMVLGTRFNQFAFVVYGTLYGYVGLSRQILREISGETAVLAYFVVTGTLVIVAMAIVARRFGREA